MDRYAAAAGRPPCGPGCARVDPPELPAGRPGAAGRAAGLARDLRENAFDRGECYRVRDLSLVKEDVRIYLTDGHLIFSKPVAGHRIAAVFTADTEGGDGEVIVFPPDRAERRSLAAFTHSPNLDDHFRSALFLFTGAEYDDLQSQIAQNSTNKKMPEIGAAQAFRDTQRLGMGMAVTVQPGPVVEARALYYQRVSIPMAH